MRTITMEVTPDQATKWLEGNMHNRPLSQSLSEKYAEEMRQGRWMLTHQGIAFDADKTLVDGQHRLWAVVLAERSVQFSVTYDVPIATQIVVDDHKPRSAAVALTLAGYAVTATTVATASMMMRGFTSYGYGRGKFSKQEIRDCIEKHKDCLEFVTELFRSRKTHLAVAPVRAAVARAYYHGNRERLNQFVGILLDGIPGDIVEDRAALALRNVLLQPKISRGVDQQLLIYAKAENALRYFLKWQPLEKIVAATKELFPLPDEQQPAAAKKIVVRKAKPSLNGAAAHKKAATAVR